MKLAKKLFATALAFLVLFAVFPNEKTLAEPIMLREGQVVNVYPFFTVDPHDEDRYIPPWAAKFDSGSQVFTPQYFRNKDGEVIYCLDAGKKTPQYLEGIFSKTEVTTNDKIFQVLANGYPRVDPAVYNTTEGELEWATAVALNLATKEVFDLDGNKISDFTLEDFNKTIFPLYSTRFYSKSSLLSHFGLVDEEYINNFFNKAILETDMYKKYQRMEIILKNESFHFTEDEKTTFKQEMQHAYDQTKTADEINTALVGFRDTAKKNVEKKYQEALENEVKRAEQALDLVKTLYNKKPDYDYITKFPLSTASATFTVKDGKQRYGPIKMQFPPGTDTTVAFNTESGEVHFEDVNGVTLAGISNGELEKELYIVRNIDPAAKEYEVSFTATGSLVMGAHILRGRMGDETEYSLKYQRMYTHDQNLHHFMKVSFPKAGTTGKVSILKVDEDTDASLKGAEFTLTDGAGKVIAREKTDDHGVIHFTDIPEGVYQLKETTAPQGYALNETPQVVTVVALQEQELKIKNKKLDGKLTITKVDAENGKPLEGAVFTVEKDGKVAAELTSKANGETETVSLAHGKYTLKEKTPPTGYMKIEDREIEINGHNQLRIKNTPKKYVAVLTKVDAATSQGLSGAVFEVYHKNGPKVETLTTETSGKTKELLLHPGDYTYREIKAPAGYELDSTSYHFEVTANGGIVGDLTVKNHKMKNKVVISKVEKDTNIPVPGALIVILDGNGREVFAERTGVDGKTREVSLQPGRYTFYEKEAPAGYELNTERLSFEITQNGEIQGKLTLTNELKKHPVILTKIDRETKKGLRDAEFEVRTKSGKKIGVYKTGRDGKTDEISLPAGSYVFTEKTAPEGYILEDKEYRFEVHKDGKVTGETEIKNTKATFIIKKVDETGGKLEGAKLEVLDKRGKSVFRGITDRNGELEVTGLDAGTYEVAEIEAPKGFILTKEKLTVRITEDGEVRGDLRLVNKKSKVEIEKRDKKTNALLSDAQIVVTDTVGKEVYKGFSKNGKFLIEGLSPGRYSYKEIKAPTGYKVNEKTFTFAINEDGGVSGDLLLYNEKEEVPTVNNPGITTIPVNPQNPTTPPSTNIPIVAISEDPQTPQVVDTPESSQPPEIIVNEAVPQSTPEPTKRPYKGEIVRTTDAQRGNTLPIAFLALAFGVSAAALYTKKKYKK